MFRKNSNHLQNQLFEQGIKLNRIQEKTLEKHWSNDFYENIFKNIDEELFSPMYSQKKSRPNVPVNILVGLEILKELKNLTDNELYENFLFNYIYQKSLGIKDISKSSFSIRTLYNFRSTLYSYEKESGKDIYKAIFKSLRDDAIGKTNIDTKMQRGDSVQISANIKKMGRYTLFHKTLGNLIKEVKIHEPDSISEELFFLLDNSEDSSYYNLKKSEVVKRTEELANFLYIHVKRWEVDDRINETSAYMTAKRVFEEQCNVENEKMVLIKSQDIKSGSVQNPSDPDATYRKKNNEGKRGYVVHASETCSDENVFQFVTDIIFEKNNVDDSELLSESLDTLKEETDVDTMVVDGGYPSDSVRTKCNDQDIKLVATEVRGKKREESLNSNDFTFDESGIIQECPNGERPVSQKRLDGKLTANFDHKSCSKCPLNSYCIAYSKSNSRLVVDEHRKWIDNRNDNLHTDEFRQLCRKRAAVEGLMEKLKPKLKEGKVLFRGFQKVRNRMTLKAIGINFSRYHSWKVLQLYYILVYLVKKWIREIYFRKSIILGQ